MNDSLNNKELVAAGHEFAKALSSDTAIIDIAKMVSRLAERLDCTTAALREMAKQRDALAAENAGLKTAIDATIGWQQSTDPENVESVRMLVDIKTPATDAYLAEVRAQGVEMFAEQQRSFIGKPSKNDAASSYSSREAIKFADQLRKGAAS
ncbi:TPA: hypothetical protein ACH7TX_000883 [Escherichia coli]